MCSWCTAVSWSWNCSALEAEEHSRCASTIAARSGLKEGPRVGCGGAPKPPGVMPPGGTAIGPGGAWPAIGCGGG
eukprot:CAMPEP_0118830084 /NCGR_PEP_ID=MMETSP1162-20130426/25448_1 /TAXON_ID=33656 /ORGANISM="Phaeocystis Sp, Strain CCMP2710" /LENGTH=74 /DNA_ID=CAMNT_0006761349 /DNA_START=355 /DNA_END=579 /DNA_ORIENTATION=-